MDRLLTDIVSTVLLPPGLNQWRTRRYARRVAQHLRGTTPPASTSAIFAYCMEALEPFRVAKRKNWKCILGQFDAGPKHDQQVRLERDRWPGLRANLRPRPAWALQRMRNEWDLADRIIVNSGWTREALIHEGVPATKIVQIPLFIDEPRMLSARTIEPSQSTPLKVLYLGRIEVMKGILYLLSAAKMLQIHDIRLTLVGSNRLPASLFNELNNVHIIPQVPKEHVPALCASHHVLVFPTLSDGFGLVQLEAMANGCTVIATPNCGRVVTHGIDGLLVPARDSDALAEALCCLHENRELLANLRVEASATALQYTQARYSELLLTT